MLNRKLGIISAALCLMAMPVVAFATTSRLEGMAIANDYSNDFTAVYGWPASITSVGNLVYAELGDNDHAMGAFLPNLWEGRYGTWAIHLRDATPVLGTGGTTSSGNPGSWGWDPNSNYNQSFDINWGKKFGTNSLGLQFNRSFNQMKDEIPGTTWSFKNDYSASLSTTGNFDRNIMGVAAGLGFDINPKTTGEVSVLWQNRTFENSTNQGAGQKYSDDGGSNYQFGFRAAHKCTPTMTLVPVFKMYNFDLSTKSFNGTTTVSAANSIKGWQIGAAGNWTIGSNDLFVLGATFAQNTLEEESGVYSLPYYNESWDYSKKLKATESIMPEVFMALETQVNPWLGLRFGAHKGMFRTLKVEGTTSESGVAQTYTVHDSPFYMNAGSSVKLGNLVFDSVLDYYFFQNPIAQILGTENASYDGWALFPKISATYRW
jgi:hypothetical protein